MIVFIIKDFRGIVKGFGKVKVMVCPITRRAGVPHALRVMEGTIPDFFSNFLKPMEILTIICYNEKNAIC